VNVVLCTNAFAIAIPSSVGLLNKWAIGLTAKGR